MKHHLTFKVNICMTHSKKKISYKFHHSYIKNGFVCFNKKNIYSKKASFTRRRATRDVSPLVHSQSFSLEL